MESMRDVLKRNLARSLETLPVADRLAAAWPVACGKALAARGEIVDFVDGEIRVEVQDAMWLEQMRSMREVLARELARIAGVRVGGIHFEVRKPGPIRTPEAPEAGRPEAGRLKPGRPKPGRQG